jgi:hypothetical protein
MSEWPCSEADLNLLRSEIPTVDYSLSLYRGLCSERVMGVMTIRDPERYSESIMPTEPDALKGWKPAERPDQVAFFLEQMSRYVAAAQQPWPDALQACFQATADRDQALESRTTILRQRISMVVLAPTDATFGITARTIAMRDAAMAAIAVELYRRQHGQLPESLDQLKPDYLPQVPIDPFDGQPLRYTVKGGKFAIYTAGMKDKDPPGEPGEFASRHDYEFVVTIPVRTPEVTAASRTPDVSVAADRAEPASAERARSESSTRVVVRLPAAGQPVVVFQLLNFTGSGDPSPTAARALDMIPQVSSVFVDQPAGEIVVGVRGTSVNTAPMKQALERAGFEIGFTSYRPSGR